MALRCSSVGCWEKPGIATVKTIITANVHSATTRFNALIILRNPRLSDRACRFQRNKIVKNLTEKFSQPASFSLLSSTASGLLLFMDRRYFFDRLNYPLKRQETGHLNEAYVFDNTRNFLRGHKLQRTPGVSCCSGGFRIRRSNWL
jgi:hypothetical protein